jgi:hypothetical protein
MNIPNKINANTKFEYLNLNFDNANPFIEPKIAEIIVAGIVKRTTITLHFVRSYGFLLQPMMTRRPLTSSAARA